ncbi:hypothetical protein HAX54_007648 [Datura stramonium]|uniref:Uncharacterized protein n=1 Tax=Datura stramonium TaxID=4076 RepID=A0ABS8TDR2_DATST|nr:hypothetical protein [Datura stramonium]
MPRQSDQQCEAPGHWRYRMCEAATSRRYRPCNAQQGWHKARRKAPLSQRNKGHAAALSSCNGHVQQHCPEKCLLKSRCRFEALGHFPAPVFHQRFMNHDRQNASVMLVNCNFSQLTAQACGLVASRGSSSLIHSLVSSTYGTKF